MILQGAERARERELIASGAYPHFPLLPLKNPSRSWHDANSHGLLGWRMGIENGPITVYLVNLFDLAALATKRALELDRDDRNTLTYAEVLEGVATETFETLDDFFDAGWMGD